MTDQERAEIAEAVKAMMDLDAEARQFILGFAAGVAASKTAA